MNCWSLQRYVVFLKNAKSMRKYLVNYSENSMYV